jgi:hypothetical protein
LAGGGIESFRQGTPVNLQGVHLRNIARRWTFPSMPIDVEQFHSFSIPALLTSAISGLFAKSWKGPT